MGWLARLMIVLSLLLTAIDAAVSIVRGSSEMLSGHTLGSVLIVLYLVIALVVLIRAEEKITYRCSHCGAIVPARAEDAWVECRVCAFDLDVDTLVQVGVGKTTG